MIREYLKLSRSFNAGLTGIAPVLGAISMEEYRLVPLFLLFLVGFFGHVYGFVVNDIMDLRVDKLSRELKDRPLVSGKISKKAAWIFAVLSMIFAFLIAILLALHYYSFFSFPFLILSSLSITAYDIISKKYPAMDVFVAGGIFLLIVYGATSIDSHLTHLAWVVCGLGTIQVLFMQFIAGGLKDVEHDYKAKASTLAIALGVKCENKKLFISPSFKALAYSIQTFDIILLFIPLLWIFELEKSIAQIIILIPLCVTMLMLSKKLLGMNEFERNKARKLIGGHYYINFSLVPIMLTVMNPWIGLLVFVPFGAFVLSNLTLHGTIMQPKTM